MKLSKLSILSLALLIVPKAGAENPITRKSFDHIISAINAQYQDVPQVIRTAPLKWLLEKQLEKKFKKGEKNFCGLTINRLISAEITNISGTLCKELRKKDVSAKDTTHAVVRQAVRTYSVEQLAAGLLLLANKAVAYIPQTAKNLVPSKVKDVLKDETVSEVVDFAVVNGARFAADTIVNTVVNNFPDMPGRGHAGSTQGGTPQEN